jgi:hypothetical protein
LRQTWPWSANELDGLSGLSLLNAAAVNEIGDVRSHVSLGEHMFTSRANFTLVEQQSCGSSLIDEKSATATAALRKNDKDKLYNMLIKLQEISSSKEKHKLLSSSTSTSSLLSNADSLKNETEPAALIECFRENLSLIKVSKSLESSF